MLQKKPFKFKDKDDGCVIVRCDKHGLIARLTIGLEIYCEKCRKWVRAEADEKQNK